MVSWKCQRNRGGASFLVRFHFGRDHAIAHDRVFILLLPCCHTQLDGRSNSMWGEKHNGCSRTDGRIMKMPLFCLCQKSFHKELIQRENFSSTKDLKPVESAVLRLGPDNSSVKLVDLELGHTLALDSRRSLLLLTTSPR